MKAISYIVASLVLATATTAMVSAAPKHAIQEATDGGPGCSGTSWPNLSPRPCRLPGVTTYNECAKWIRERAGAGSNTWWICSSGQYKE